MSSETICATNMGGGELFDGSAFDDERVSSSSTSVDEATAAVPTSGATETSIKIEQIRITRQKEDPILSTDTSEEIEITEASITCTRNTCLRA
nr:hypothetical protein [Tanacetum cinerariifolium]